MKYNSYKKIEGIYDAKIKKIEQEIMVLNEYLKSYNYNKVKFKELANQEAFVIYTKTGKFPD